MKPGVILTVFRNLLVAACLALVANTALVAGEVSSPGTGSEPGLEVSSAYFRILPPGQAMTSAYMVITNTGSAAVTLVGLGSDAANKVELHQHLHESGMMKMRQVPQLTIAAGEQLVMQPGGYHLMLFGLRDGLAHGDKITIELTTSTGGITRLEAIGKSLARRN